MLVLRRPLQPIFLTCVSATRKGACGQPCSAQTGAHLPADQMAKIRSIVLFIILLVMSFGVSYAQDTGSLSTGVTSTGGGEGAFFDLTAGADPVTITGFEINRVGSGEVRVYYKTGSYVGFETNAGAWTLLGSQVVNGGTGFIQTLYPLNVGGVTIPAGSTYGLLIWAPGYAATGVRSIRYETAAALTVSSPQLTLTAGAGSFGGSTDDPFDGFLDNRVWRGTVFYRYGVSPAGVAGPECPINDGRVNHDVSKDCAPPVAIYCEAGEIHVYGVNQETGQGYFLLDVSEDMIAEAGVPEAANITLAQAGSVTVSRLVGGYFQVNAYYAEGKPYTIAWDACPATVILHLEV